VTGKDDIDVNRQLTSVGAGVGAVVGACKRSTFYYVCNFISGKVSLIANNPAVY
jgi:hypothetical protein